MVLLVLNGNFFLEPMSVLGRRYFKTPAPLVGSDLIIIWKLKFFIPDLDVSIHNHKYNNN